MEAEIELGGVMCFCCGFGGWIGERREVWWWIGEVLSDGIGVG